MNLTEFLLQNIDFLVEGFLLLADHLLNHTSFVLMTFFLDLHVLVKLAGPGDHFVDVFHTLAVHRARFLS